MKTISDNNVGKRLGKKPQMNADERRFVNFKTHQSSGTHSETKLIKSPQSTRRTRSIAAKLFALQYRKVTQNGTRMTRIARIFTDYCNPCASASSVQSVFYPNNSVNHASVFICVHPRLMNLNSSYRLS
jgi:hypothetical protein